MNQIELMKVLKDKNGSYAVKEKWFLDTGSTLEDPEEVEAFQSIIEHIKEYGLMTEVVMSTTEYFAEGNSFSLSLNCALGDWDL